MFIGIVLLLIGGVVGWFVGFAILGLCCVSVGWSAVHRFGLGIAMVAFAQDFGQKNVDICYFRVP